jgi:hypothetical protein
MGTGDAVNGPVVLRADQVTEGMRVKHWRLWPTAELVAHVLLAPAVPDIRGPRIVLTPQRRHSAIAAFDPAELVEVTP